MEDLDALLADLQNTSSHITSHQVNQRQSHTIQSQDTQPFWQQNPHQTLQQFTQQHQQHSHQQQQQHSHQQQQQHSHHQQQQYCHQQPQQQHSHQLQKFHSQHLQQNPCQQHQPDNFCYPGTPPSFDYSSTSSSYQPGCDFNYQDNPDLDGVYHLLEKVDYSPCLSHSLSDYRDQAFRLPPDQTTSRDFGQSVVNLIRQSVHSSSESDSAASTPPPLPPPPLGDVLERLPHARDQGYPRSQETLTFHVRETDSPTSTNRVQGRPGQEIRHGQDKRMSALSGNLSELDQLLQDLNSAQFLAEVDKKSSNIITFLNYLEDQSDPRRVNEVTVNGLVGKQAQHVAPKPTSKSVQRSSVDNLLDELEGRGPQTGRFPVDPHYQELNTVTTSNSNHAHLPHPQYQQGSTSTYPHQQNTSSATRELDELMMSLSEFKMQNKTETDGNEPTYAKPIKSRSASSSSPTTPHGSGPGYYQIEEQRQQYKPQRENGLETMLGDLQSDMSRQGVSVKQKGLCAACQKPIVGQVIAALGRTWHVEHFVCAHCDEPLGTRSFYERDSLAYCERDYHHLFAPKCAYCNGPIVDKCVTALEKMWHPEHFFCAQCGRPFGDDDFHEKNGKAYCREDYFQMFAPKCGGCAMPIMENYISALNRQWHPECFVCWECRSTFGAGSFFDYEGLPYCETHYHARKGSLCASCDRPITGRCITAMFQKFHPEHFVCAFCLKQLNKGTFKEQNHKPYCHPCFVKLFG